VLPFLVKALLDNRARYEALREELGEAALFGKYPQARGYLRPREGYRLYEKRGPLCEKLRAAVRENREWLAATLEYPLP